jgi:hypothetical protein
MLYLDHMPSVKVGVLLGRPCPLTGRVGWHARCRRDCGHDRLSWPLRGRGVVHEEVLGWRGATSGFRTVSWESARTASSTPAVRAPHLVPCGAGRQGGQEPPPPRHPRQRQRRHDRPFGPARHPHAASRRRGQATGGSRGRDHRVPERRWPRSPRDGDEGPRGQRVRHQLTPDKQKLGQAARSGRLAREGQPVAAVSFLRCRARRC